MSTRPVTKEKWSRITIVIEKGCKMPTISGKWKRLENGNIRAWYTPDEYSRCLELFEIRREVENENA